MSKWWLYIVLLQHVRRVWQCSLIFTIVLFFQMTMTLTHYNRWSTYLRGIQKKEKDKEGVHMWGFFSKYHLTISRETFKWFSWHWRVWKDWAVSYLGLTCVAQSVNNCEWEPLQFRFPPYLLNASNLHPVSGETWASLWLLTKGTYSKMFSPPAERRAGWHRWIIWCLLTDKNIHWQPPLREWGINFNLALVIWP